MNRAGWSQPWSQSSIFNMKPFDLISNFVSPVLDIMSPLDDIRDLMSQGARLYGFGGPSVLPKVVQQQKRRKSTNVQRKGQLLPQKYRIVIDCTGIVDPNLLKTNIKCVQDCKHLIVSASNLKQQGRQQQQFKRSYTLPVECDVKKMTKFVTPQHQLVIEFNYMDVPLSLAIMPEHEICSTAEHGKCVHIKVPIADFVEPAKVKVHVKAKDLFVHFEERIVPVGDWCARVIYHTRVQLPQNVNFQAITAKCDKHKLTILAPIGVQQKGQQPISKELHDIAVKRKLRHRKARAVSVGAEQKQPVVGGVDKTKKQQQFQQPSKPSISGQKQKQTPLDTSLPITKPSTTPIGGQEPTISKKKQKKSLLDKPEQKPSILKPDETKTTPSISEQKPSLEDKKPAQQLPIVSTDEKKKKKKKSKKSTTSNINMPSSATSTDKSTTMPTTSTTPTSDVSSTISQQDVPRKEPSPVNVGDVGSSRGISEDRDVKERSPPRGTTDKGTDILKNIFGGGSSQQQHQQGSQSATTSTDLPASSMTDQVPESGQRVPETGGPIQF